MGSRGWSPKGSKKSTHPLWTVYVLLVAPYFSGSLFWLRAPQDQPFQALRTAQGEHLGPQCPSLPPRATATLGRGAHEWPMDNPQKGQDRGAGGPWPLGSPLHQARKNATAITAHTALHSEPSGPGSASPRLHAKLETACLFRCSSPMPKDGPGVRAHSTRPTQLSRLLPAPLAGQQGPFLSAHHLPLSGLLAYSPQPCRLRGLSSAVQVRPAHLLLADFQDPSLCSLLRGDFPACPSISSLQFVVFLFSSLFIEILISSLFNFANHIQVISFLTGTYLQP